MIIFENVSNSELGDFSQNDPCLVDPAPLFFFFFCDLKIVKKDFKIRPEIIFLHVQSGYVRNPCLQKKDSGFGYCPGKNPLQLFYYDISLIFVQQMLAQSNLNILLWNFMKRN